MWLERFGSQLPEVMTHHHEMELAKQCSRHWWGSVSEYYIKGLGLPLERLYFKARSHFFSATNELQRYRAKESAVNRANCLLGPWFHERLRSKLEERELRVEELERERLHSELEERERARCFKICIVYWRFGQSSSSPCLYALPSIGSHFAAARATAAPPTPTPTPTPTLRSSRPTAAAAATARYP